MHSDVQVESITLDMGVLSTRMTLFVTVPGATGKVTWFTTCTLRDSACSNGSGVEDLLNGHHSGAFVFPGNHLTQTDKPSLSSDCHPSSAVSLKIQRQWLQREFQHCGGSCNTVWVCRIGVWAIPGAVSTRIVLP